MLLAALVINLVNGVLYAWSIFGKALTQQWAWTSSQASLPYALAVGLMSFGVMVAGRLQDRFGPRPVALAGAALAGIGIFVSSFATPENTLPVVIGFGVMGGLGIGCGCAAATPPVVKWFGPRRKGLVTGIVVAGFGLASIYIAPLTTYLIDSIGISQTFRTLGVAFFLIAVIGALLLRDAPEEILAQHAEEARQADTTLPVCAEAVTTSQMLRTSRFYLMWVAYVCAAFAGLMIIGVMANVAAVQIPSLNLGFLLVAALAIGNALGRLIAGVLVDRIGFIKTMLIAFIGQAIAMCILGSVGTLAPLIGISLLIGAFYGANLSIFPAMTADFFGTRTLGANYGVMFTAYGIGGIFGSLTAARLFDITGSFQSAFYVAAGLCVIAAFLAPLAGRKSES